MEHANGNLVEMAKDGKFDVIIHCANCYNVMGAGIAKQIKIAFPEAYKADQATLAGNRNKLGTYSYSLGNPIVVNAYAQFDYGPGERDRFEYDHFNTILQSLKFQWPNKHYGFPYLGVGLCGGNKARIVSMIKDFDHQISHYGGKVTLVDYQ